MVQEAINVYLDKIPKKEIETQMINVIKLAIEKNVKDSNWSSLANEKIKERIDTLVTTQIQYRNWDKYVNDLADQKILAIVNLANKSNGESKE